MTTRTFTLNVDPHAAVIGDVTLWFQAEAVGTEFLDAYKDLRAVQQKVQGSKASSTKHAKAEDVSTETLAELHAAMRSFVGTFLMPESRDAFTTLRLPDRVLLQLVEYMAELYGSGTGNPDADGGTSSD